MNRVLLSLRVPAVYMCVRAFVYEREERMCFGSITPDDNFYGLRDAAGYTQVSVCV